LTTEKEGQKNKGKGEFLIPEKKEKTNRVKEKLPTGSWDNGKTNKLARSVSKKLGAGEEGDAKTDGHRLSRPA